MMTKDQQDYYNNIIDTWGQPPEGTTHLDMGDGTDSSFMKVSGDDVFYWGYEGWDKYDGVASELKLMLLPAPNTRRITEGQTSYDPFNQSVLSVQEGGDHYKKCGIQPIEYIHANGLDYFQGNVVKYVTRHKDKNGKEDIKKAIHYLNLILEMQYND